MNSLCNCKIVVDISYYVIFISSYKLKVTKGFNYILNNTLYIYMYVGLKRALFTKI